MEAYLYLIIGFIFLIGGSEILIRGSVSLASILNVSPFVIGVVVVAGGTSLPELASSIQAIRLNIEDIVIGNVVGSNIANIILIIGAVAVVHPIIQKKNYFQKPDTSFSLVHKVAFHVGKNKSDFVAILTSIFFIYCCLKGEVNFLDGILMLVGLAIFIYALFSNKEQEIEKHEDQKLKLLVTIIFLIGGLFGVIIGSWLFIDSASIIATSFGISATVIGITIVAFGTSLPELTTGLMAAFKKQTDFAIGNILGSNIYNILGVLGVSSLIKNLSMPELDRKLEIQEIGLKLNFDNLNFDAFFILFLTLLFLYLLRKKGKIGKITGIIFLLSYFIYIGVSI